MKVTKLLPGLGAVTLILILALCLSSCFSLPGGIPNPFADLSQSVSNRVSGELVSASGISGMTNQMMFNMVYAQVFFMGGFGADFYDLAETQGTVWRVESREDDGSISIVEAERALLKILPNGDRWYYLSWRADGEEWSYEALMNDDLEAKKIRYFNPDVKRVEESTFDAVADKDAEDETAAPEDAAVAEYDLEDFKKNIAGREIITVGGSSYTCDRIVWSYTDEEEKVNYTYTWWVDSSAPGGLVKYEWTRSDSKETLRGELVSFHSGYNTRYSSY
ncbi:MAG: hypothetical protein KKI09_12010 [Spirochaetes bacterium]|nr:hypothetical protein [Spirochaetota bacterium]MBU0956144.1 hypothetical protein [Spirochaetota bacterium]